MNAPLLLLASSTVKEVILQFVILTQGRQSRNYTMPSSSSELGFISGLAAIMGCRGGINATRVLGLQGIQCTFPPVLENKCGHDPLADQPDVWFLTGDPEGTLFAGSGRVFSPECIQIQASSLYSRGLIAEE